MEERRSNYTRCHFIYIFRNNTRLLHCHSYQCRRLLRTPAASSVVVNPLPVATITPAGTITFCNGKNVLLKANTGTNYTYQWKKAGVNITENGTQANYTASVSGIYSVLVTNAFGCSATSAAINVTVNSSPPELSLPPGHRLFAQERRSCSKQPLAPGIPINGK